MKQELGLFGLIFTQKLFPVARSLAPTTKSVSHLDSAGGAHPTKTRRRRLLLTRKSSL